MGLVEELMSSRGSLVEFGRGGAVAVQGEALEHFFLLLSGSVKVERAGPDGRTLLLCFDYPPGFIGDLELLGDRPQASCSVTATSDLRCLRIGIGELRGLAAASAPLALELARSLAAKLEAFSRSSATAILYPLKVRYAGYLLEATATRQYVPIALERSSALLGSSPRQLQRVIRELEAEGLALREGRRIGVADRAALRRLAEGV